jgi:hypothetical protein
MISKSILNYANSKGLDWISTGGGFDYIFKPIDFDDITGRDKFPTVPSPYRERVSMILTKEDGSPENLSDTCEVMIFLNQNWTLGVSLKFKTAKSAMNWMAKTDAYAFDYENYIGEE